MISASFFEAGSYSSSSSALNNRGLLLKKMSSEWSPLETNRHQDHVIAHVRGATALGYFEFDQAAHILLDIGFFWSIFVDGEMALVLQSLAVKEFELEAEFRTDLFADLQSLHD